LIAIEKPSKRAIDVTTAGTSDMVSSRGDRAAERRPLGPLDIDVDPLEVAGGLGELVHPLLGDLDPVAVAEVPAHRALDTVDAPEHVVCHLSSLPSRGSSWSGDDTAGARGESQGA
jgi:hypothetical protein